MKDPPDDYDLQDVTNLEGFSRRRFLLGTLLSPSVIPQLWLAATEESLKPRTTGKGRSTSLARPRVRGCSNLAWPAHRSP